MLRDCHYIGLLSWTLVILIMVIIHLYTINKEKDKQIRELRDEFNRLKK
jgi:hypothetical protein